MMDFDEVNANVPLNWHPSIENVVNFFNCPMAGGRTPESPPTNVAVNVEVSTVGFAVPLSSSVVSFTKFAMAPGMVPALPGSPKIQHTVHVKCQKLMDIQPIPNLKSKKFRGKQKRVGQSYEPEPAAPPSR